MNTYPEIVEYFAANPDGFLTVQTVVTSPPTSPDDREWRVFGEGSLTLFQVGRIPGDYPEYINIVALDGLSIVDRVAQRGGKVNADVYLRQGKGFSSLMHRHTLDMETVEVADPGVDARIGVLRWKNEKLQKAGLVPVNTAEVFRAAKNTASAEFFASLFAGSKVPSKNDLWEGVRILNEQIQVQRPDDEALKLDDPVTFTHEGVSRDAKVVELFPADDKVVVMTSKGQTALIPYADVTKLK